IAEEVQLPLDGLTAEEIATVVTVFERAVAAGCTVERTVVPGVEVTHTVLGAEPPDAATLRTSAPQTADSDAPGTPESRPDEDTTPDGQLRCPSVPSASPGTRCCVHPAIRSRGSPTPPAGSPRT